VSPAKMSELIEVPFEVWTWADSRNHTLDGGIDPAGEGTILGWRRAGQLQGIGTMQRESYENG